MDCQGNGWNLEHSYAKLPKMFYHNQKAAPVNNARMVVFNAPLAQRLGLSGLSGLSDKSGGRADVFTGNALPPGAMPIAQAYAGYQFGHFAMLGDGRALLLGEQVAPDGRRFDIQLKGSGITPFSRGGDGLAALGPMLREYIVSEAMFHLGVPTSRSLAVALTGEDVIRERVLPGAVLTRVAASHIRVGTFNYAAAFGKINDLRELADYTLKRHFPWLYDQKDKYTLLLREVAKLQADLIAKWQHIGFIHGVMNTDNMAISGETIDYGPCAYMNAYDPATVFSSIDKNGRYAYENQPAIGAWNLARLAESLLPLFSDDNDEAVALAKAELDNYWERYNESWLAGMRAKLGIFNEEHDDALLISRLMDLMADHKLDYTNTFRALSHEDSPLFELGLGVDIVGWGERWRERIARQHKEPPEIFALMRRHNPAVIPRNHRVEEALRAAEDGDLTVMDNLLAALRTPYDETEGYAVPPEPTAAHGYRTFCGT